MVKVVGFERAREATVLRLDKDDGETHLHMIPDGIIEDRMEAYGISRIDALNLLLVEAHSDSDGPVEFNGVDPAEVCRLAAVSDEMRSVIARSVKAEVSAISQAESIARIGDTSAQIDSGYERLAEERLADEIISDNPELKRAPRVQAGEPVGLTVKFI